MTYLFILFSFAACGFLLAWGLARWYYFNDSAAAGMCWLGSVVSILLALVVGR